MGSRCIAVEDQSQKVFNMILSTFSDRRSMLMVAFDWQRDDFLFVLLVISDINRTIVELLSH